MTAIFSYILSSKKSSFGIIGNSIQLNNIFYYYPYFILGVLCRKYISLFYKFIHNKLFILSIASCYFTSHIINSIPLFIKCISIIFLLYYILEKIFIDNKDCVPNCNKIILSIFTNLGKYSLEIYFIHFFLLFKLPENVSNFLFFLQNDNCWWGHSSLAFAEFIILFPLIIIIAYSCIWISYFIKQIPFCGKIFFGKE